MLRASSASAKHSPTLATSVVSLRPRRATTRIRRGTTIKPTATNAIRKPPRRPIVFTSAPADSPAPDAAPVRMASSSTAIRSSTMTMPNTISVMRPLMPISANAFTRMVVLEMAISAR